MNVIRQAHMNDDELYQHAMGPMTQLINQQNSFMQIQIQPNQMQSFPQHQQQGSLSSDQQMTYPPPQQQQVPQPFYRPVNPPQLFPHHPVYLPHQLAEFQRQPNQLISDSQQYEQLNQYNDRQEGHSGSEYGGGHYQPLPMKRGLEGNSGSTSNSELSHPIQIESSMAPIIQITGEPPTTVDSSTTQAGTSSISSFSSKNSPFNGDELDRSNNMELYTKDLGHSPSNSVQSGNPNEITLIRHQLNEPQFDLSRYPEFFDETIPNAFARVFLLKEVHSRLQLATSSKTLFYGMLLQGVGKLSVTIPELEAVFLKYRGKCMNTIRNQLSDIQDSNAEQLLILTSVLNSSSIYIENITMKDFFSLASGPAVLLKTAFEDPSKFQKSFIKLKNHADGLLFTARSVWNPRYNHRGLFEFLEVVKEFGAKYIEDEDFYNDDDLIKVQYKNLVDFIEFALNFLEGEKSNKHVLLYPVNKIYKLVQLWYQKVPSEIYTFGSATPPVEKVFYVFWFALGDIIEDILVGGRYIFTFLFNGFYLLFPFNKHHLYQNMEDEDLRKHANYLCRIIAFLNRRKAYIVRNTILNDPIPSFFDSVDRFKPRALDIHERCITSFKYTNIKPYHYPSESTTSGNLINGTNYYKTQTDFEDGNLAAQLFSGLNTSLDTEPAAEETIEVDLLDVDPKTGLLNDDYDPRFNDPIFQSNVLFQSADLDFLIKYHEDRKLIIQLDMED